MSEGPVDHCLLRLDNVRRQLAHVADGEVAELPEEEGLKVAEEEERLPGLAGTGRASNSVDVLHKGRRVCIRVSL